MNDFYVTRDLFRSHTSYERPLSYGEWKKLPDDHKAAVLYVQFFETITLAWYKLKSIYSSEADGVAEVLQYLQKNVSKIEADEKRFSPAYIYKVCYNCLYCLCRDPNRYKAAYENECSNIVGYGEDELDLFDTVIEAVDGYTESVKNDSRVKFWNVIDELEKVYPDVKLVVAKILGGDVVESPKRTGYTAAQYQKDLHESWKLPKDERKKFMDSRKPKCYSCYTERQMHSVREDVELEIIEELRQRLESFRSIFNV